MQQRAAPISRALTTLTKTEDWAKAVSELATVGRLIQWSKLGMATADTITNSQNQSSSGPIAPFIPPQRRTFANSTTVLFDPNN